MSKKDYGVYLVTDTQQCGGFAAVVETVVAAVKNGVTTVQIRDKHAEAVELLALLEGVAEQVGDKACVLLDDRVDVYLAAKLRGVNVHGIHVGQKDIPVAAARELIGPDAVLGLTANTPEHLAAVAQLPAGTVDYLGIGAIRATATKPNHPTPLGVAGFAELAAATDLPCVAIGGIGLDDLAALKQAGAQGAAVVSAICKAADAGQAAAQLTHAWEQ